MPRKGAKQTEEAKQKISKSKKGHECSEETRNKISRTLKGKLIGENNPFYGKHHTKETRQKISEMNKGKSSHNKGKKNWFKHTEEWKNEASLRMKGYNHPLWKGGITPVLWRIRHSKKMKQWREQIFARDNYTCIDCNSKVVKHLQTHHIKKLHLLVKEAKISKLGTDWYESCLLYKPIWDIDNGLTLCYKCHRKNGSTKWNQKNFI